ncbi:DeoR/GlpR family DNA-binding transcription regulator [Lachnospira multipara]|uniref:DeoR/GlpR family DNA-binding transcription regulator n=1 Tax=Lachnospira multipara TaxID=28051 RepID=UPI0004872CDB|nr:DeoR/GlpR family DNA-binding transcription regulator [Lachnospira multipara]
MLTKERHDLIVKTVNENNTVTVAQLVEQLGVSEATVRRDLNALDRKGLIIKVFGGATAIQEPTRVKEFNVPERAKINIEEKDTIAKYAASLIHDEDLVFIDSGTTTLKLIDYLKGTKATFVTNGIVHAAKLASKGYKVYIVGGRIRQETEAIVGPECIDSIYKYNFTKSFLGANGITKEAGFTTPDVDEALIKTKAIERSYTSYVLVDHTKFGLISTISFSNLNGTSIITDYVPETFKYFKNLTVIKELNKKNNSN